MKKFAVVGPGLSGTHLMMECLREGGTQIYITNSPHTRIVPKISAGNVLYIYADPRNVLLNAVYKSLKKIRQPKLRQKYGVNSDLALWTHCLRMEGDIEFVARNADNINIEHILNMNYDPMKLEEHFMNWLTAGISYKLMMLKYEALANSKTYHKVLKFFDIKKGKRDCGWRPRRTDYLNLPLEQQVQITELFKNLLKKQAEIPPIYIRNL